MLCFFLYYGFDLLTAFTGGKYNSSKTLVFEHINASMSRGVVDSRDVIYFVVTGVIFNTHCMEVKR